MCKKRFVDRKVSGLWFEREPSQIIHRVFHIVAESFFLEVF